MKHINIDTDLYNHLREYCDSRGIRFIDFVEATLETATHLDHVEDILNNEAKLVEKMKQDRRDAIRYGFRKGVCTAILAVQGKLGVCLKCIPEEAKGMAPVKPVTGSQLGLFD